MLVFTILATILWICCFLFIIFLYFQLYSHLLMLFVMWKGVTVWKLLKAAHQKSTESWTRHGGWIQMKGRCSKKFWKCWTISELQQCEQRKPRFWGSFIKPTILIITTTTTTVIINILQVAMVTAATMIITKGNQQASTPLSPPTHTTPKKTHRRRFCFSCFECFFFLSFLF